MLLKLTKQEILGPNNKNNLGCRKSPNFNIEINYFQTYIKKNFNMTKSDPIYLKLPIY